MSNYNPWRYVPKVDPLPPKKKEETDILAMTYQNLRIDGIELEELIGGAKHLSDRDRKRLDKAVTVMKVGMKLIKKVLKAYGYRELKPTRQTENA